MDKFKFIFLLRGELESLSLCKFLTVFKILPYHEVFFGNLNFAIIAQMFCRSITFVLITLKSFFHQGHSGCVNCLEWNENGKLVLLCLIV